MKKLILVATAFALSTTADTTVSAQSAQERLDDRYDRALAAGYKALMLCSAIANAHTNGVVRTPESIHKWELAGIQTPLDTIISSLSYQVVWATEYDDEEGSLPRLDHVKVTWAEDAHPRWAAFQEGRGCFIGPIQSQVPETNFRVADAPEQGHYPRSLPDPMAHTVGERLVDVSAAFDGTYGASRTTAVTVLHDGKLVGEQFAEGFFANTPQRTWSVAKSIAATLVGAAVHLGEADVQASAGLGVDWGDPRQAITIEDGLRMASGRYSDTAGNRTDPLYWGGTSVDERAQNWPLIHQPGTVYRYANNDTLAAVKAIAGTFETNPPSKLFAELGMHHTVAEEDASGNFVLSSQVWSTSRDLAKLGQLYLNDGVWKGKRLLPEGWRDYVSDPSGPQPVGTQWGYGAGWWTFRRPEGNAFEGIPDDAFAARGNRGQYVVVVPSRNVVIVRRGEDMVGTRFDIAAFTRDVLVALEE
jgi:CubicO group peptidase (beta-lactamase class C family)